MSTAIQPPQDELLPASSALANVNFDLVDGKSEHELAVKTVKWGRSIEVIRRYMFGALQNAVANAFHYAEASLSARGVPLGDEQTRVGKFPWQSRVKVGMLCIDYRIDQHECIVEEVTVDDWESCTGGQLTIWQYRWDRVRRQEAILSPQPGPKSRVVWGSAMEGIRRYMFGPMQNAVATAFHKLDAALGQLQLGHESSVGVEIWTDESGLAAATCGPIVVRFRCEADVIDVMDVQVR